MSAGFAYAAAAVASLWLLVHLFLGGRDVAGPLRAAEALPVEVRATAWMCWHMVTAAIFLAAALPLLALWLGMPGLMLAAGLLNAALAVAGIIAAPVLKVSYKLLPQGWLFVPPAVLAFLAV